MASTEALEPRRLFAALVPDVTFGQDGRLESGYGSTDYFGQTGGRLVVGQRFDEDTSYTPTISRYHADGTPDRRFRPINPGVPNVAADVDADGRVIVGVQGRKKNDDPAADAVLNVARYTATGRRDTTFAASLVFPRPRGRRTVDAFARTVQALPDGTVAVLVDVNVESRGDGAITNRVVLAKLNADGSVDSRFGTNGCTEVATNFTDPSRVVTILADSRGRLYLRTVRTVARLAVDGSTARAFGDTQDAKVLLDASGRLVVARPTLFGASVSRYTQDGKPDPTFAGGATADVITASGKAGLSAIVADGDALVVQSNGELFRIDANGSVSATGDTVTDALIDVTPDGRLLAYEYSAATEGSSLIALRAPPPVALGASGTIYLRTGDAADTVYVRREDANRVRVGVNGRVWRFPSRGITAVNANLGGGDNALSVSLDVPAAVVTGAGRDTVVTGAAADRIDTGRGGDRVSSGGGGDRVEPGNGTNFVDLGTITGDDDYSDVGITGKSPGFTTVRGRGGRLRVYVGDASTIDVDFTGVAAEVSFSNSTGDNRVRLDTTEGSDVFAGSGDDSIVTGRGDDTLAGGPGRDTLRAGGGDDELRAAYGYEGGSSRNVLDGGPGTDRYLYERDDDELIDVEILLTG